MEYHSDDNGDAVMPVEKDAVRYNMDNAKRGKAVIFNIKVMNELAIVPSYYCRANFTLFYYHYRTTFPTGIQASTFTRPEWK